MREDACLSFAHLLTATNGSVQRAAAPILATRSPHLPWIESAMTDVIARVRAVRVAWVVANVPSRTFGVPPAIKGAVRSGDSGPKTRAEDAPHQLQLPLIDHARRTDGPACRPARPRRPPARGPRPPDGGTRRGHRASPAPAHNAPRWRRGLGPRQGRQRRGDPRLASAVRSALTSGHSSQRQGEPLDHLDILPFHAEGRWRGRVRYPSTTSVSRATPDPSIWWWTCQAWECCTRTPCAGVGRPSALPSGDDRRVDRLGGLGLPQVRPAHISILADLLGRAGRDNSAEVEHHDTI